MKSDLDDYQFNELVAHHSIKEEVKNQKEQQEKLERKYGKR